MPLVALVGRPNVGKSTLFNRLTEEGGAITAGVPGVTRDRLYGTVEWSGQRFDLVDTGGFVPRSAERFEAAVREQTEIAVDEADLVLYVADARAGLTDIDAEIADRLRTAEVPAVIVANKADRDEDRWNAANFYQLGLGEVFAVSAESGSGTGDLLDGVLDRLPGAPDEEAAAERRTRVAVAGRPNVGKSSFINALLGHGRTLVTEVPGTTRDAVNSFVQFEGRELELVDTAGLRKQAQVEENVEFYATLRTERAVRSGDVVLCLVDATQGLERQDQRIISQAAEQKAGLVLGVNKWDLVEKDASTAGRYADFFRGKLGPLDHVPIRFISAKTHQRIYDALADALDVADRRREQVQTSDLNSALRDAVRDHPPASHQGRHVKINYATQVRSAPPVFAFFTNHPEGVRESYRRYLEGRLRETFDFAGVPLTLAFREK
ncbi:MAG: ribosome biogenesis GTPase Der [Bacteroidetes bacterium QS_8_68_15]|nr:MAG: ribosome biogenesis GTPase Der [Bacteroidetes bacterium QS_8_68_15]